jgi:hypothetical protein
LRSRCVRPRRVSARVSRRRDPPREDDDDEHEHEHDRDRATDARCVHDIGRVDISRATRDVASSTR